jgi:peptide chain release factor 1
MKESIRQRLQKLSDRFEEVGRLLATDEVAGGSQQFRDLSMEYARLEPLAARFRSYHGLERDLAAARELQADADAGMRALGDEEVTRLQLEVDAEEEELRRLLLPKDPRDDKNIFRGARGTGEEAAILRGPPPCTRYAESRAWPWALSEVGEHGGYKEIISRIAGRGVLRA